MVLMLLLTVTLLCCMQAVHSFRVAHVICVLKLNIINCYGKGYLQKAWYILVVMTFAVLK